MKPLDCGQGGLFNFVDLDKAISDSVDPKTIQSPGAFARDASAIPGRIEHAEMASALEQRIRRRVWDHAHDACLVGPELHVALLVRARDAQCAEIRAMTKEDAADEDPPSRFALRRGKCADALRDKCYWLPRGSHSFNRNTNGMRKTRVTDRGCGRHELGPHSPAETDEREPNQK